MGVSGLLVGSYMAEGLHTTFCPGKFEYNTLSKVGLEALQVKSEKVKTAGNRRSTPPFLEASFFC